jgi:hypothetical protein
VSESEWLSPCRRVEKVGEARGDGMLTAVLTTNNSTHYLINNKTRCVAFSHVQCAFLSETPEDPIFDGIVALDRLCEFGCLDAESEADPPARSPSNQTQAWHRH